MDYSDEDPTHDRRSESDNESSEDEGDDAVIRRIPVYYNPTFLDSLTLLQYPDRQPRPHTAHPLLPPSLRPQGSSSTLKPNQSLIIKHKPHTQHLSLSLPIERNEDRWNEDVAADMAKGLEDTAGGEGDKKARKRRGEDEERRRQEEMEGRRLDRIEMSSISVPDVTNYLVGVMREGKPTPPRRAPTSHHLGPGADLLSHLQTHSTSTHSLRPTSSAPPSPTSTTSSRSSAEPSARRPPTPTTRTPRCPRPSCAQRPPRPCRSLSSRLLRVELLRRRRVGRREGTGGRGRGCLRRCGRWRARPGGG